MCVHWTSVRFRALNINEIRLSLHTKYGRRVSLHTHRESTPLSPNKFEITEMFIIVVNTQFIRKNFCISYQWLWISQRTALAKLRIEYTISMRVNSECDYNGVTGRKEKESNKKCMERRSWRWKERERGREWNESEQIKWKCLWRASPTSNLTFQTKLVRCFGSKE